MFHEALFSIVSYTRLRHSQVPPNRLMTQTVHDRNFCEALIDFIKTDFEKTRNSIENLYVPTGVWSFLNSHWQVFQTMNGSVFSYSLKAYANANVPHTAQRPSYGSAECSILSHWLKFQAPCLQKVLTFLGSKLF